MSASLGWAEALQQPLQEDARSDNYIRAGKRIAERGYRWFGGWSVPA